MRRWWIALIVVALATAGCAEDRSDEGSAEAVDGQEADADNETNVTQEPTNVPPVADLSVDAVNGTAPLDVNFTLEGSDDDGDDLTWTFSVGLLTENGTQNVTQVANGTELPATVAHNLTEAGNFSAIFEVSDGTNTSVADVTIEVLAPAAEPVVIPEPVVITGSALVPNPVVGSQLLCLQGGVDGDIHDIAPAGPSWEYTLEDPTFWTVYWWGDGSYISTGADTGVVPDGADQAEVCSDAAAADLFEYTLTITHPDWEA